MGSNLPFGGSVAFRLQALVSGLALIGIAGAASAADIRSPASLGGVYFSGDLVYAFRSTNGQDGTLIRPLGGGPGLLTAGQFDTSGVPGADVRLGWMGDTYGIEGRFLGGFRWKDTVDVGPAMDFLVGAFAYGGAPDVKSSIESTLNSGELNLRAAVTPDLTVFGGVRYLDLDDRFDTKLTFQDASSHDLLWRAHTTGWGPQIGAEGKLALTDAANNELVYLKADGRIGYLFTSARNDFSGTSSTAGLLSEDHGDDRGGTMVAELGVVAGHNFTRNIGIEVGYRVLYLPKVVTGTGLAANATATFQSISDDSPTNRLLVQAFTVGLHMRF